MQATIKLSEILSKVKPFSEYVEIPFGPHPDLGALESELQTGTYIYWSDAFNQRVKVIPVNTWFCTDTLVGVNAYYLDGQFVALSFQRYRKSHVEFKWTSIEDATKVQALIRKISADNEEFSFPLICAGEDVSTDWLQ